MAFPTGPTGAAGPTGIYGLQGPVGAKGVRGLIGPSGWSGFTYAQTFANMDSAVATGSTSSAIYRSPSGFRNSPPLVGSNSTSIIGLTMFSNASYSAKNVFYVPPGSYFIQATTSLANYFNQPPLDSYLVLSTCSSSTGGSETDIGIGAKARENANAYLSGMFYFSTPTYLGLRQYGGTAGSNLSPIVSGFGDTSLNNVMLSFLKI